ncbi:MAG: TonB-dependent receptor [Ignavibacteriales bacterium]|jgi:outer membrane receptor protein involved in Fe transport|nr:MAG: TonB-dependent receptor [Ignavibacteriales bacterium]
MKKLLFGLLFAASVTLAQSAGQIVGKVIDKITKQPIPGVNILVVDTQFGAASDLNGNYEISNVPIGNYQLRASAIGYSTITRVDVIVNSARPAQVNFELSETILELEDVTVTSDLFETEPTEVSSIKKFSYEEIRRSPGGFEDVVRALSVLPGVAQQSSGRNDLVVRGGAPSENLYIVDGFVFPTINHFGNQGATGGPLSFVNLDFVEDVSFSTGGFSSLYGDKLSSVLNIDLRNGRNDRLGGKATISASQFGLNLEGPTGDQSDFIFSIRRSYLDFIFNAAGFNFVPEYYDLLGKYNFNIDNSNRFSFLFIGALDRVKFNNNDEEDIFDNARILGSDQNQYVTGINYDHLFGKGILSFSASRSYINFESFQNDTLLNPIFKNNSKEAEHELKGELVYKLSSNAELNAGASAKFINFDADVLFPNNFVTTFGDTLTQNNLVTNENFTKLGAYLQYSNVFFNRLRFNLGGRVDYFDAIENQVYVSPRFSTAYNFNNLTSLNFSTGIYYQFPSYIWLLAGNRNLDAIRVNQYVLGLSHRLSENIRIKLEGFYKDYQDYPTSTLRPYLVLANTGAGYGGSEDNFESFGLEPLISEGYGRARGVEFSVQKRSTGQGLYGLLSATYSQSDFTSLDGIERPSTYEQELIFNVSGGYIFNAEWEVSFKFRYASGRPSTPYNFNGTQTLSNYLTESLPPIHALDLRVDKRWDLGGLSLITYLDIQNIYNRSNIQNIRWDYKEMKVDDTSSIGILPSIGISLEF